MYCVELEGVTVRDCNVGDEPDDFTCTLNHSVITCNQQIKILTIDFSIYRLVEFLNSEGIAVIMLYTPI